MKNKILILLLALISFSCFDKEDKTTVLPSGTYTGTFFRSGPLILTPTANVSLVLDGNSFSGSTNLDKYPAIGTGTFFTSEQEITFDNTSIWTANFDWTLILDGTFTISSDAEGFILLTRRQGDITDTYRLKRVAGDQ